MAKATSSCSSEQWSTCRTFFSTSLGINFAKLTRAWLALISMTAKINSLLFLSHNSLRNWVVSANTTDTFKARLDKFWHNQDIVYDFRAQLQGTGSRSEVLYE